MVSFQRKYASGNVFICCLCNICCWSEIQIWLGILYFNFLNLVTLQAQGVDCLEKWRQTRIGSKNSFSEKEGLSWPPTQKYVLTSPLHTYQLTYPLIPQAHVFSSDLIKYLGAQLIFFKWLKGLREAIVFMEWLPGTLDSGPHKSQKANWMKQMHSHRGIC